MLLHGGCASGAGRVHMPVPNEKSFSKTLQSMGFALS